MKRSAERPLENVTVRSPNCPEHYMEWQQEILPCLPRLGRCRNCGCVQLDRSSQTRRSQYGDVS